MLVIRAHNLSVSYGQIKVIKDADFSVKAGEFFGVVGPYGCGKTTLLKVIGGLKGFDGKLTIRGLTPMMAIKKGLVGFNFQKPNLLPWRSVIENVMLPLEIKNIKEKREIAKFYLSLVGLLKFEDYRPDQLSGGMQQLTALARSLVLNPEILLMDEPFASLDEITRERLNVELLTLWRKMRKTIIFVTHSLDEAVFLCDRVLVISKKNGDIKRIFAIPINRPRDLSIKQNRGFRELVISLKKNLEE